MIMKHAGLKQIKYTEETASKVYGRKLQIKYTEGIANKVYTTIRKKIAIKAYTAKVYRKKISLTTRPPRGKVGKVLNQESRVFTLTQAQAETLIVTRGSYRNAGRQRSVDAQPPVHMAEVCVSG